MNENAAGVIFGAVLVVALGLVLLLGCTAGINPDVDRFGDAAGRGADACAACGGDFGRCCDYGAGGGLVCVDADGCP